MRCVVCAVWRCGPCTQRGLCNVCRAARVVRRGFLVVQSAAFRFAGNLGLCNCSHARFQSKWGQLVGNVGLLAWSVGLSLIWVYVLSFDDHFLGLLSIYYRGFEQWVQTMYLSTLANLYANVEFVL